jgi:hypothetical protein
MQGSTKRIERVRKYLDFSRGTDPESNRREGRINYG